MGGGGGGGGGFLPILKDKEVEGPQWGPEAMALGGCSWGKQPPEVDNSLTITRQKHTLLQFYALLFLSITPY